MQGTMKTVGQKQGTWDCGFFAGFAVNLHRLRKNTAHQVIFTDTDVFEKRNEHLDQFGGGGFDGPTTNRNGALTDPKEMQRYLRLLGCKGYSITNKHATRSRDTIKELLRTHAHPYNSQFSLLFSIGSIIAGHWICILGHASTASGPTPPTLWKGKTGTQVESLQEALNAIAPTKLPRLVPDGIFGSRTKDRVVEFQRQETLEPDGIVGPLTWGAINSSVGVGRLYGIYDSGQLGQPYRLTLTEDDLLDQLTRSNNGVSYVVWHG